MTMGLSFVNQSLVSRLFCSRLRAAFRPRAHASSTSWFSSSPDHKSGQSENASNVRLSKLLSRHAVNLAISRRQAENLIEQGQVTLAGLIVRKPHLLVNWDDLGGSATLKVRGKAIVLANPSDARQRVPKVWAVHKLAGEAVAESDPHDRPSLMQRLARGGVGRSRKQQFHLKPIGRLDIPTEGLILVTNDGDFARRMELPSSGIHRVYRVRVHGRLTKYKLDRIRRGGIRFRGSHYYGPMKVEVERSKSANTWLRVTSIEGKNRQVRNVFKALGVTRLIRIAYGDYELQTIPPGVAIEVAYKPVETQKARGALFAKKTRSRPEDPIASPVQWIQSV